MCYIIFQLTDYSTNENNNSNSKNDTREGIRTPNP